MRQTTAFIAALAAAAALTTGCGFEHSTTVTGPTPPSDATTGAPATSSVVGTCNPAAPSTGGPDASTCGPTATATAPNK